MLIHYEFLTLYFCCASLPTTRQSIARYGWSNMKKHLLAGEDLHFFNSFQDQELFLSKKKIKNYDRIFYYRRYQNQKAIDGTL